MASWQFWLIFGLVSVVFSVIVGARRAFGDYFEPKLVMTTTGSFDEKNMRVYAMISVENNSPRDLIACRPRIRKWDDVDDYHRGRSSSGYFQWSARSVPVGDSQRRPQNIPAGDKFYIDLCTFQGGECPLTLTTWNQDEPIESPGTRFIYNMRLLYGYGETSQYKDFWGMIEYEHGWDINHVELTEDEYYDKTLEYLKTYLERQIEKKELEESNESAG